MSPSPVRIVQVTDTHIHREPGARMKGMDTNASLLAVLEAARGEAPDLVLVTGDLVHDGSPQGYRRLGAHLERLGAPALCIPGNHDDPRVMAEVMATSGAPAGQGLRWLPRAAAGAWELILLNTFLPGEVAGALDAAALTRLDADLARSEGPALVTLHHQPAPVGSSWMDAMGLREPDGFWAVIDRHPRVKVVLWGHVHQAFEGRRGDVALLATPSTCVQFAPGATAYRADDAHPGYRVLDLHPDGGVDTRVVRVPFPPRATDRGRASGPRPP